MTVELVPHSPEHAVALAPGDLPAAQTHLGDWCKAKIRGLARELRDARLNERQAKAAKWKHSAWTTLAGRLKRRMVYYAKIKLALEQGFLIIPNLPVEIMAVRVARLTPAPAEGQYPSDVNTASADLLPPGQGRYVDETTYTRDASFTEGEPGNKKLVKRSRRADYNEEIDFPVVAVNPVILDATRRAMALRLFDEIGVATGLEATLHSSRRQRRSDPVVVGRLIDPVAPHYSKRVVSFFIAWWLDPESL